MNKKITLCGSTKFREEFDLVNAWLSLNGHVVYSCAIFGHQSNINLTDDEKETLDQVHKLKILNSDEIYVINVDKYIGNSTASEIKYAQDHNMPINYFTYDYTSIMDFKFGRLKGVVL